ncbi:hypothetical protein ES319_D13G074500v1 [Gossypium barbadense]|uniref:CAAX prenyl protease 2/Lysostaphin resistance protein A-like domain-containing protein n=1 Tax=Gossypium barbadense TaxID=3634 RepID=A0A5J5NID0_GOSBA|nr:hypothetical protein ES319_D13G074500v1 [Gossypium barbadense]
MILASPILNPKPKFGGHSSKSLAISTNPFLRCSFFTTKFSSTLLKCHCGTHNKDTDKSTQALSLLVIDILELLATLFLLKSAIKPNNRLLDIFKANPVERNWLLASALGFGVLILLVFLTSIVVDGLYGIKDVNNLILKEMLVRSDISKGACITVYCIITPILEEMVYRGFMLASLASTMNWKQAVVISAAIFSAAHLSGENFLQLFVIGCILGCSYCGTGNLSSSILIHSLYNAFTLIITFLS